MTTRITTENITDATIGTADLASSVPLNTQWQSVFTGDGSTGLTTVAGRGYFIDTTSGTVTVTLPASPSAGDVVVLKDYARTWATNNVTTASALFDGVTTSSTFSTEGQTVTLVYMDGTKGWSLINEDTTTGLGTSYISATGGTITTSGDFKVHTFTGDGCFVVSIAGSGDGPSVVDYLVVAGGGGGGAAIGGGGGAGGFRLSNSYALPAPTTSPLANPTGITVTATTYPVTVGSGGTRGLDTPSPKEATPGSPSIFSTITSTSGGRGVWYDTPAPSKAAGAADGGSGGGDASQGGGPFTVGAGNTPPVSPSQGNPGGPIGPGTQSSGGGGGAGGAGQAGSPSKSGDGGVGSYVSPSFAVGCAGTPGPVGSTRYFAGGGGGSGSDYNSAPGGTGGAGGGGNGRPLSTIGSDGTANTGGGGGSGKHCSGGGGVGPNPNQFQGYNGGSGIVLIRYKFQN